MQSISSRKEVKENDKLEVEELPSKASDRQSSSSSAPEEKGKVEQKQQPK